MANNDELKILECLQCFTDAWSKDGALFDECLDDEPLLYFSMFGYGFTRDMLRYWFKPSDELTIKIVNHATLIQGITASQYATIIGLYLNEKGPFPRHLAFGGSFVNKLINKEGRWLLKEVRFDLQSEDKVSTTRLSKEGLIYRAPGYGDMSFVKGWKTIDDRIGHNNSDWPNNGFRTVSPEYDTPWYCVKNPDNRLNDEEAIKEKLYKYCYAFDFATFHLICDDLTDDCYLKVEEPEFHNARDSIGYLKQLRKTMSRSQTNVIFDEICIDGDRATAVANRIAPDLKNVRYPSGDLNEWIHGRYKVEYRKNQGNWQISSLVYEEA